MAIIFCAKMSLIEINLAQREIAAVKYFSKFFK